jgi:hypothetical protein
LKINEKICPILLIRIALVVLTSGKLKYEDDYIVAQVNSVDGKYVFFYSKPYHPHDTVFKITTVVFSNSAEKGSGPQ